MAQICPHCHKIVADLPGQQTEQAKFFPFCSLRCKLIDLAAWLDAKHKIITQLPTEQTGEPSEPPSDTTDEQ